MRKTYKKFEFEIKTEAKAPITQSTQPPNACEVPSMEVIKLLHEEWRFRVSHLSSLIIKTTSFNLLLIFLPIIPEKLSNKTTAYIPMFIIPLAGLLSSLVFGLFASSEMNKIMLIKESLKRNTKEIAPQFSDALEERPKKSINHYAPSILYIIQSLLAIAMIVILRMNR